MSVPRNQVVKEMGDNPLANKRRGVKDIWKSVDVA
jgi:hypothetical protein